MIAINEPRLESDLGHRFQYLTEFMGFGPADVAAIHASAPALAGAVPNLVDAVWVVDGDRVVERLPVAARGRIT